jgi:ABC-2 type transport system permease protein
MTTTPAARTRKKPNRAWVIARTDLRQLRKSRDFWIPLAVVAALFFVVIPALLLTMVVSLNDVQMVHKLSGVIGTLPKSIRQHVKGNKPEVEAAYALSVYLFAPLAIIVPLTISSAVGSHTIIGERERGSGEFLSHSPATESEIYTGKLMASLIPGYLTALLGFGLYSLVVNLIVGPKVGGWFFPTASWWLLVLWVLPPFIALAVCLILAISARVSSAAAAQQASALVTLPLMLIAFSVASGSMYKAGLLGVAIGTLAWLAALMALWRGSRSVTRERLLGIGG